MVIRPRVSYADLQQAPEDGRRYELYDGEVVVVPSPLPIHQIVADNLYTLLRTFAAETGGLAISAPLDIVFSEHDVVQPDVVFFTKARQHFVELRAPARHAPDLAVEVLSPSTRVMDRGRKMQMLARYGVPEYWLVDPDTGELEVYSLEEDGYRLAQRAAGDDIARSVLLRDLAFEVAVVFPAPESEEQTPDRSA